MDSWIGQVMHPERFHGLRRAPPFFEGWYYKLVDQTEQHRLAIIPALFLSDDPQRKHAFVQVMDGASGLVTYHRYPAETFSARAEPFSVTVADSTFSLSGLNVDIRSPERTVQGRLTFHGVHPWPVSWHAPGIMGPLGWLPFLECYHGVLGFDHEIRGTLVLNGEQWVFDGGRGYIEKDWGRAFPSGWVWMQSNHFGQPGTSLTASIARIPLARLVFGGHIVGLWHSGRLHAFTTWNGARVRRLAVNDSEVHWVLRRRSAELEIVARRAAPAMLLGPSTEGMSVRVDETLNASIDVRLTVGARARGRVLFEGTGRHGGLEVAGNVAPLLRTSRD